MFEKDTVIQCCVTPAILKQTMKTRKSTKATKKNYKTSTMTINLITKKECKFLKFIKTPCINALQNQGYEKINRDKL
jgi:hypothetical protein